MIHKEGNDRDSLDWNAAITGLDLIVNGKLDEREPALTGARVARLLGRLLDEMGARGRDAYDGEDIHLRRAIDAYMAGKDKAAVKEAWKAARIGRVGLFGEKGDPDRSAQLRELLRRASLTRGGRDELITGSIRITPFDAALRWRQEKEYAGRGGVVVLFNGEVQGWVNMLRNPEHWQPGCIAVDEGGRTWTTIAGNDRDGALMWLANYDLGDPDVSAKF